LCHWWQRTIIILKVDYFIFNKIKAHIMKALCKKNTKSLKWKYILLKISKFKKIKMRYLCKKQKTRTAIRMFRQIDKILLSSTLLLELLEWKIVILFINAYFTAAAYQFYKTKLCPYLKTNNCIKGVNCSFAHSEAELRNPSP